MKTKVIAILAIFAFVSLFIYSRKEPPCTIQIETLSGELYTAKRINYYISGFADVQLCDGERIILQTATIDTIKQINE